MLKENVANKIGYGENPFSEYLQHEGTLIGVYCVPKSYPYYKLYAPFPTRGSILKRIETGGWVVCHCGGMLMGFHSARLCTWAAKPWSGNDMLWCDARTNGWVVETAELADYAGGGVDAELRRFADAVLKKTHVELDETDPAGPRLRYRSLTGHTLDLRWIAHGTRYVDQSKVDGEIVNYPQWPRLDSPWVSQALNSPVLHVALGGHHLNYDFSNWTREED